MSVVRGRVRGKLNSVNDVLGKTAEGSPVDGALDGALFVDGGSVGDGALHTGHSGVPRYSRSAHRHRGTDDVEAGRTHHAL